MKKISLCWFRRDLRIEDQTALFYALQQEEQVLPLFIFDRHILDALEDKTDARVTFIYQQIASLKAFFEKQGSSMLVKYGHPEQIFQELVQEFEVQTVYTNRDYEPYAQSRDAQVEALLAKKNIPFLTFKDQVIFEPGEILNGSGEFYKVFTPFSRNWLEKFRQTRVQPLPEANWKNLFPCSPLPFITLSEMGFEASSLEIPSTQVEDAILKEYEAQRNFPAVRGTSRLGIHLRFGTVSIRGLALKAASLNATYLNELIWREFYMMILGNAPQVVDRAFKPQYDRIPWRTNEEDFQAWCEGRTGYPIVDAGMRELNATGFMHNRVRMIVASFLTKHLLIDWRWGEAYFAQKLLDFDLAANNGGWQWASGSGCDAAPYFRVFNPYLQTEKFDPQFTYIKKWVPEFQAPNYPKPIVNHEMARKRVLEVYAKALKK
mgnify:CR=1 FL=1